MSCVQSNCPIVKFTYLELCTSQYYLEKNLDARMRELEREAELEEKAPKVKAKSKMSKVFIVLVITGILKLERKLYGLCCSTLSQNSYIFSP